MSQTDPPRVVIFAGPNGAGKSTHADAILAALGIETFVNADFIARGLSGRNTDTVAFEAGRIMLKRLRQLGDAKADFAFESTLASRTFARCRAACEVARGHGWPPCATAGPPNRRAFCRPAYRYREHHMAQTAKTQPSRLTPSPKALQKALAQSAKQAQLLAQAFGVTVPTTKTKPVSSTRPT